MKFHTEKVNRNAQTNRVDLHSMSFAIDLLNGFTKKKIPLC
jgi:hypothetical protein